MASTESGMSASGVLRLADEARQEGYEVGMLAGQRNGRTSAFLAAEKIVRDELAKPRPDFEAVADTLAQCSEW